MLLLVTFYFLLACVISWLVLFPASRESLLVWIATTQSWLNRACAGLLRGPVAAAATLRHTGSDTAAGTASFLRRNYLLLLGGAAIVTVPPLLALTLGRNVELSGYDESMRPANSQVASLLVGEQLVPPEALPPLLFTTPEVAAVRPLLVSASRNWALLRPDYSQRLLMVFKIMKEKYGYDMAILEGYRSPERQTMLAGLGGSVTNAAAFQSWHQYGLAADCAFVRDGKLVISEKDPWAMRGYQLYGQVAESVGMTWGGRWKMMDFGHTELRVAGVIKHS